MPTHSEAMLEAMASCPPGVTEYATLEIWHTSFTEAARIVANVADDIALGIEVGAPRNSGETVTFIACPVNVTYPEQREGQPPSVKVTIDNVNRELVPKIRTALGYRADVHVLYREYLNTDLTEPAYGPVEFTLKNIQMVGNSLTGTAMVKNLANKRFPRADKNYSYTQFRSLLP